MERKYQRTYKNPSENAFAETARSNGWAVTKLGWPDFFCEHEDGRIMAVEVKPKRKRGTRAVLKTSQIKRLAWLQSLGVACYVSIADKLVPFDENAEWQIHSRKGSRAVNREDQKQHMI
jgi:hypothetical protein